MKPGVLASVARRVARSLVCALAVVCAASTVFAQSPGTVAVVINDNSADSRRIGQHYVEVRRIPASNVFHIQAPTEETIDRGAYAQTIEQPLALAIRRAQLQDRIQYLVLTKGVPLRIAGTSGIDGTLASVDSELTLLYRRMTGVTVPVVGSVENPYFLGDRPISDARPFSHRDFDIYLVTRIDAFTVDQALALVDRAQAPRSDGRIVLDQRSAAGSERGDQWMQAAAARLKELAPQVPVVLESTAKAARGEKGVLGYYAWGAADPENRVRSIGMEFAPGAIAANLSSFDARTFHQPPDEWRPSAASDRTTWFEGSGDALIGDLIRNGVSGVSGQVGEAFMLGAVRPDILFPAYLSGFNLAEAFYLSVPTLGWQTVVVGDPLAALSPPPQSRKDESDESFDAATGLPAFFAQRRLAAALASSASRDLPPSAIALMLRAEMLLGRDDVAGGRRALEGAVAEAPQSAPLVVRLAQLEESAGDYTAAIAHYRRAIELDPGHVTALNNLAYALAVRQNAPAEALPVAQRAAQLASRSASVLDTLGWVEHLNGNDAVADTVFAKAIQFAPGEAEIHLHAAAVCLAVGKRAQAGTHVMEALRLQPALDQRDDVRRLRQQLAESAPPRPD